LENYLACFEIVVEQADYITFNLSCPNVKDHRGLISRGFIDDLLSTVKSVEKKLKIAKPIFIKIPPITDIQKLKDIVEMAEKHKIAGIIATNTKGDFTTQELGFQLPSSKGGVSGRALHKYSVETVKLLRLALSSKEILIIGVGGIFNAQDALAMIRAGASLLQIYTGFIYEGPMIARRICEGILAEVKQRGVSSYQELIGVGEK
jgi:dihydroorotate dehydrogenase